MSFDDARIPGHGQAGDDGVTVAFQACGEAVEAGEVVPSDCVEPVRQESEIRQPALREAVKAWAYNDIARRRGRGARSAMHSTHWSGRSHARLEQEKVELKRALEESEPISTQGGRPTVISPELCDTWRTASAGSA